MERLGKHQKKVTFVGERLESVLVASQPYLILPKDAKNRWDEFQGKFLKQCTRSETEEEHEREKEGEEFH